MEYVRKIPLLLGTGAGLFIGLLGLSTGVPNKDNVLNMCVGMVVFYLVGLLVRSTISQAIEKAEAVIKQREEEQRLAEELEKMKEQIKKEDAPGSHIDLTVGDDSVPAEDDFDALPIAEFIRRELE